MIDKKKENTSSSYIQASRSAKSAGENPGITTNLDPVKTSVDDGVGERQTSEGSNELDVLEQRVLGAVRGAVTDVIKEGNRHPELPEIDMDFTITEGPETEGPEKISGSIVSEDISVHSQHFDSHGSSHTEQAAAPDGSIKTFISAISGGAIFGVLISIALGIVPLPFNLFSKKSEPIIDRSDASFDYGKPNSFQPIMPLPGDKGAETGYFEPRSEMPTVEPTRLNAGGDRSTSTDIKQSVEPVLSKMPKKVSSDHLVDMQDAKMVRAPPQRKIKQRVNTANIIEGTRAPAPFNPAPIGQLIVLQLKGGTIEISGRLKEADNSTYVLTLANKKDITVKTDLYNCISDNCPKRTN